MRVFNLVSLSGVALSLGTLSVQAADVAWSLRASTLGLGLEVTASLTERIAVRVGANGFAFDTDLTESGIDYEADLQLLSVSALVDWHPAANGFRVSAGLLINENELDLTGESDQDEFEIGDTTYTSDNLRLSGLLDFEPVAPYLGIGWNSTFTKDRGWGFSVDLGVVFQGEPRVTLNGSGRAVRQSDGFAVDAATDPRFQQDLLAEEDNLERELDDFEFYPVVAIGAVYRF